MCTIPIYMRTILYDTWNRSCLFSKDRYKPFFFCFINRSRVITWIFRRATKKKAKKNMPCFRRNGIALLTSTEKHRKAPQKKKRTRRAATVPDPLCIMLPLTPNVLSPASWTSTQRSTALTAPGLREGLRRPGRPSPWPRRRRQASASSPSSAGAA